jgi:breast cancer 2 susceptibility protein
MNASVPVQYRPSPYQQATTPQHQQEAEYDNDSLIGGTTHCEASKGPLHLEGPLEGHSCHEPPENVPRHVHTPTESTAGSDGAGREGNGRHCDAKEVMKDSPLPDMRASPAFGSFDGGETAKNKLRVEPTMPLPQPSDTVVAEKSQSIHMLRDTDSVNEPAKSTTPALCTVLDKTSNVVEVNVEIMQAYSGGIDDSSGSTAMKVGISHNSRIPTALEAQRSSFEHCHSPPSRPNRSPKQEQQSCNFFYTQATQSQSQLDEDIVQSEKMSLVTCGGVLRKFETHSDDPLQSLWMRPGKILRIDATESVFPSKNVSFSQTTSVIAVDSPKVVSEKPPTASSFHVEGTGTQVDVFQNAFDKKPLLATDEDMQSSEGQCINTERNIKAPEAHTKCIIGTSERAPMIAFTTAGRGAVVSVSEASKAKAAAVLCDEETPSVEHDINIHKASGSAAAPMIAFTTAGRGAVVSVSEASKAKAVELILDEKSLSADDTILFSRENGLDYLQTFEDGQTNNQESVKDHCARFSKTSGTSLSSIPRVSLGTVRKRSAHSASAHSRDLILQGDASVADTTPHSVARPGMSRVSFDTSNHFFAKDSACVDTPEPHVRSLQCIHDTWPEYTFVEALSKGNMTPSVERCKNDGVHEATAALTSKTAAHLRFHKLTELPLCLALDACGTAMTIGSSTDYQAALQALGCDCSRITSKWIENHTRWIIWKLASIERRFSPWLAGSYLTFSKVSEHLHRRFIKEILKGSRPVLRKILNRDMAASHMMILCVADVQNCEDESKDLTLLELTDGWYSVRCQIEDSYLKGFIACGRIKAGTKLLISSACLVGGEDGVDPNDASFSPFASGSPTLKISANGTRVARWNARLGLVNHSASCSMGLGLLTVTKMSDVLEGGGSVPSIDLFIVKKYPLKYLLKSLTGSDGPSHIITEAEESRRYLEYERNRQMILEKFSDEIESQCQKVCRSCPTAKMGSCFLFSRRCLTLLSLFSGCR